MLLKIFLFQFIHHSHLDCPISGIIPIPRITIRRFNPNGSFQNLPRSIARSQQPRDIEEHILKCFFKGFPGRSFFPGFHVFKLPRHMILKEKIDCGDNESSNEKSCQGTSEEISKGSANKNKYNRSLPPTKFVHMRMTISGVLRMSIDF